MNCREINQFLDTHAAEDLPHAQREAIDTHMATCHACSEIWANWREIMALPVPATPASLRGRIAAALPAQREAAPRRVVGPWIIGGLLLAGVAAAVTLAIQSGGRHPQAISAFSRSLPGPAMQPGQEMATPTRTAGADSTAADVAPATADSATAALLPIDAHSIVVLKRPEAAADAQTLAALGECHDAIVRQLRAVGLKVIADAALLPHERSDRVTHLEPGSQARFAPRPADLEIARKLGGGNLLIITTDNGCGATQFNSPTGDPVMGVTFGGRITDGWEAFANGLASGVRDKTLKDEATVQAEARAILLNSAFSDSDRMQALSRIHFMRIGGSHGTDRKPLDRELVAAAAQLGTNSTDPNIRSSVWASLRQVNDPALVQPLLQALATDPAASVRMQAALDLNIFLDRPGVAEALRRAAAEDPSSQPEVACCILTVREAAQRSAVADEDFHGWVRSMLFDESLPARSRLLNVPNNGSADGRFLRMTIAHFGAEAAREVFDIGRSEQDPRIRSMAWGILKNAAPDEAFVPVLIADLIGNQDEFVRSTAAEVLARFSGNPQAREAVDRARNDPSINVRRAAGSAAGR